MGWGGHEDDTIKCSKVKVNMANRRSFKSDESFLEKISIGAVGTRHVLQDLAEQGHNPIELERGSNQLQNLEGD